MIVSPPMFDRIGVCVALATDTALSATKLKALKRELSAATYDNLTLAQKLVRLNEQKVGDNTTAQALIPVDAVPFEALQRWASDRLRQVTAGDFELGAKWGGVLAGVLASQVASEMIAHDSDVVTGLAAKLAADGVDPALDALFSVPDPSYVPRVTLPSVAETITGVPGAMLLPGDVAAAEAL